MQAYRFYFIRRHRYLVFTELSVLIVDKKFRTRRCISTNDVLGVTKSLLEGVPEFIIHVRSSYDEYLRTERVEHIIRRFKLIFAASQKKNLSIFGVETR